MKQTISLACSVGALVIATLGATPLGEAARSAAAQVVPRNSIGPLQLKRNSVGPSKIAPNAIRTGHVQDGVLLVSDFKAGQIPQGPKGDKGDTGAAGATNVVVRRAITPGSPVGATVFAECNVGERALGGGFSGSNRNDVVVTQSSPIPSVPGSTPTGWQATAYRAPGSPSFSVELAAWVICARP